MRALDRLTKKILPRVAHKSRFFWDWVLDLGLFRKKTRVVGEIEGGPGETPVVDGGVGVILGVLRENQVLNVHLATPSSRLDGSSIATCTIDFRHAPASIHVEPG